MAKECCEKVNEQPGSCNPCCMPLLSGVRAVAVTDIAISIILITVVLVVIFVFTDISLFLYPRTILFFIFVTASLVSSILVLALVNDRYCWPCQLWAVVNGFRLIIDLVYYFVMVANYRRGKGRLGFPLENWVFAVFSVAFLCFLVLYIWFVIVMLAYASYINRKSLLENQALAYQKATEEAEAQESCIPTSCPSTDCSTVLYSACYSYCPPYPCSTSTPCQPSIPYSFSFRSSTTVETNNNFRWSSGGYRGSHCC